jgi:hypothetical protein
VRDRIAFLDATIVSLRHQPTVPDQHRPHRHATFVVAMSRLFQRKAHEPVVVIGGLDEGH